MVNYRHELVLVIREVKTVRMCYNALASSRLPIEDKFGLNVYYWTMVRLQAWRAMARWVYRLYKGQDATIEQGWVEQMAYLMDDSAQGRSS